MGIWNQSFEDLRKPYLDEEITLTRGDYGSRNVVGSAWHTAAKRNFKGYKAGGGLTPQFKLADEFQLEGNQRDPEGQEKERKTSKQSDPSKDNFTGISGSIATIMKQNAAMRKAAAKKKKEAKEEVEVVDEGIEDIIARLEKKRIRQGGDPDKSPLGKKTGRAMKSQQDKARKKESKESVEVNHIDGSKTEIIDLVKRPAMVAAPKLSNWKEEMEWQDEALKPDRLKIKEGGVKNKIEINPEIKTEGYASTKRKEVKAALKRDRPSLSSKQRKKIASNVVKKKGDTSKSDDRYAYEEYDNTKSPDYEEKKKRLAKKHGGKKNIKGHPQYEHYDIDEGIGSWVQTKLQQGFNAADKVSAAMDKNPVTSLIKKGAKALVSPINPNATGKNYPTAADQKAKGLRVAEQVEIEEKKKLSNCSPLIDRVSKWSKTMKKEEVISERDVYIKSWNRNPLSGLPDYKQDKKRKIKTANPVPIDKASYEPEGEVIQEKPGDGWIGPTVGGVGIPNPIRITKDIVDKANRKTQEKVNKVNQISPGSASMPNVNYFNKGPSAATKRLGLNSYEPEGEVIAEKDYHRGTGEKVQKRTLAWMKEKGKKGAPGLDAMKEREAEHKAKRGKKQSQNNSYEPQGEMLDEKKKKKDDTYLETDFKKRLKNNEKARKELQKGPQMKNPHLESIEVVVELNRYGKETGKATGSLNKRPGSRVEKGGSGKTAVNVVRTGIRKQTGKPEGQRKTRKKGEKTADMKGPSPKLKQGIKNLQKKRDLDKKARDAGYTNTQDYVNVQARYPDK